MGKQETVNRCDAYVCVCVRRQAAEELAPQGQKFTKAQEQRQKIRSGKIKKALRGRLTKGGGAVRLTKPTAAAETATTMKIKKKKTPLYGCKCNLKRITEP